MPAEDVAAETKEAATIDAVSKTYVESSQVSSLEEMDVILPPEQSAVVESIPQECTSSMPQEDEKMDVMSTTKQSVVESVSSLWSSLVAHECTSSMPQVAEEKGTIIEEQVKENELATRGRVSSWIAAYVPKSLLGFFQRRCMKKTNLVVLCLALLLPMALARR
ncbi:unnamed protein product [Peronospora belbahrii]|uniref:Uncharacterized protein n=1 Tax=Peronospora belbahrii TaxID=622444 RepID=A0AAU9L1K5_9STRA|nr:unnamed protein product [Peronospora belbahrii]